MRSPHPKHSILAIAVVATFAGCDPPTTPDVPLVPSAGDRSVAGSTGYVAVDLGTLGGAASIAAAINEAGRIVGSSAAPDEMVRAALWQDGEVQDLGTLGGNSSFGVDINVMGQVVGYSSSATGATRAFVWEDGVMTALPDLGGTLNAAIAINDRGRIVGYVTESPFGQTQAVLWRDGALVELGTLGGASSQALGINNADQVVGAASPAPGVSHAFLWEDGVMTDLGTLGGSTSLAAGINDVGQVVGYSQVASGEYRAFLWEDGVMTELGNLSELDQTAAINEAGLVVGLATSDPNPSLPVVWQDGVGQQLPTLGGDFGAALDVDASGRIVGATTATSGGALRATLWLDPAPGPRLEALVAYVRAAGIAGLVGGDTAISLARTLETGLRMIELGEPAAAAGLLGDFIDRIEAAGGRIPPAVAGKWIAEATAIIGLL